MSAAAATAEPTLASASPRSSEGIDPDVMRFVTETAPPLSDAQRQDLAVLVAR